MLIAGGGLGGPVLYGCLGFRHWLLLLELADWGCIWDSRIFSVALPVVTARVGDLQECLFFLLFAVRAAALKGLDGLRYCCLLYTSPSPRDS